MTMALQKTEHFLIFRRFKKESTVSHRIEAERKQISGNSSLFLLIFLT